jgi:hypothetical protein
MGIRKDLLAGAPISVEKHTSTIVAVSYKPFYVPSKYFERNARRKNGREGERKDFYAGKEKTRGRRGQLQN